MAQATMAGKVAGAAANYALAKLPAVASSALSGNLLRLMDLAIDGYGKLPSVKNSAGKLFQRRQQVSLAAESLIRHHTIAAAAQGAITNIGGLFTAVIGTPANITGIIVTQIRLAAGLAHIHGYDIDDRRVRTAVAMCLLGERELSRQLAKGQLPTTPLAVATSPVFDPSLYQEVAQRVMSNLLRDAAGKGLASTIARKAPLIGGGVGGAVDGFDTYMVSRCVRRQLPLRRATAPIQVA
ncbi:MAG: EcsC family protein [Propionibacteriaceae bacterium]|jgi:hypothetical protein|nr:EcsC family protein [Propionibacteriaceae bacterium]